MKLVWKDVQGYEGHYQVSDTGLVRSLDRTCYDSVRHYSRNLKGKILRPTGDKDGYLQVVLCRNGVPRTRKVHRLVAEAFIDNPPISKRLII